MHLQLQPLNVQLAMLTAHSTQLQPPQALFDLPRRMRAALEEGALETAVDFYSEAQPLLAKYGGRGTLKAVAAEAEAAARDAGAALKRALAERRDDAERAVLLLRRLGEGDESLQVGGRCRVRSCPLE